MLVEANIILRDNQVEPLVRLFDLDELEDLHVVFEHFTCESVWADVDYIHVGVLYREDSRDLRILLLFELLHGHSLHFCHRERVDMDLDSLLILDIRPAALEFFLHVAPDLTGLVVELMHLNLRGFLELVESEFALDDRSFDHEELELREGRVCLMAPPGLLDLNRGKDWPVRSLVLVSRIFDSLVDLHPV